MTVSSKNCVNINSKITSINIVIVKIVMVLTIVAETAPLDTNADGVVRVGKTRVTLDTVVAVFKQGVTAEEIVYRFPSLKLADVYATIGFYLNHQQEVEAYLRQRQKQSQEIRKVNESRFDSQGLRDRLLARRVERSSK
ncbi:hypothetical protein DSM107010_17830 [Chroococcidiopsis cubana SAG 39.79]|nr:hypothetical protein DSM107010_17830 [Chroococcidiopsis cubana SAG 39.79]